MKTFLRKPFVFATILFLVANVLLSTSASAQITQPTTWTKAWDQGTATGTANVTIGSASNRILVVAITASVTSSTSYNVNTITYGGVTLSSATSNLNSSAHAHSAIYYLKDNAVMDGTSRPLVVTLNGTPTNLTVWYAVFAGVDQTAAYVTGNGNTNTDGSGPAQLSTNMAIAANSQPIYVSCIQNSGSTTTPGYTINGNWASGGSNTGSGGGEAWKNEVAKRTIQGTSGSDNAATSNITPTNNIRWAISALVLPQGPPVLSISGSGAHGSACVGVAANTITYTINNTGSTASGITVTSNNPQFVVSNLSSTTVASGGSATYQVTFTPSASGSQTATITVASTTSGSNSPISSLTGSGNAVPVTSVVGQSDVNCFAGNDGSITIGVTGGLSPYFYSVNNGTNYTASASATPFVYGGLQANTQYRIKVKDSNGCFSK